MNTQNWTVTVGQPTTDQNNKVNLTVTYAYDDGTNKYSFTDSYSGILGNDNLLKIIQDNLVAHDQTVQGLLSATSLVSGQIDLSQLFPTPVQTPTPMLTPKVSVQPTQSAQLRP